MTPEILMEALLVIACMALQAFFSGSEIALVGSDRLILKHKADNGDISAKRVLRLLERPTLLVGTCLIGTSVFAVSALTLFAHMLSRWSVPELVIVAIYTPISIVMAELIPKSIFHQYATTLAPIIGIIIGALVTVLRPVLWLMEGATQGVMWMLGVKDAQVHTVRREDIQLLLDDATIHAAEKEMIQRVFDFSDTLVAGIMVPLIEVVALPDTATCEEAAQAMSEAGHSRLPIYRKRVDRIVGVVAHQDVLFAESASPVTTVLKPVMFAPETQRVEVLFRELRKKKARIAVVVDEYGGAIGMVSVEDILEEIVGEIDDEFTRRTPLVRRVGEREWLAAGRIELTRLETSTGFNIPEGDYETLAGFLLDRFGHIPAQGERLTWGNWAFTVSKANERAILEVNLQDMNPKMGRI